MTESLMWHDLDKVLWAQEGVTASASVVTRACNTLRNVFYTDYARYGAAFERYPKLQTLDDLARLVLAHPAAVLLMDNAGKKTLKFITKWAEQRLARHRAAPTVSSDPIEDGMFAAYNA